MTIKWQGGFSFIEWCCERFENNRQSGSRPSLLLLGHWDGCLVQHNQMLLGKRFLYSKVILKCEYDTLHQLHGVPLSMFNGGQVAFLI